MKTAAHTCRPTERMQSEEQAASRRGRSTFKVDIRYILMLAEKQKEIGYYKTSFLCRNIICIHFSNTILQFAQYLISKFKLRTVRFSFTDYSVVNFSSKALRFRLMTSAVFHSTCYSSHVFLVTATHCVPSSRDHHGNVQKGNKQRVQNQGASSATMMLAIVHTLQGLSRKH